MRFSTTSSSRGSTGSFTRSTPPTDVVQSVRAFRGVADVPGEVDLAVIAVPAEAVLAVARECAVKGVRALTVISAGFAEIGPRGAELQTRAGRGLPRGRDAAGRAQLPRRPQHRRGFAPQRHLRPDVPPPGNVGFVTQSGALGLALIDLAADRGLGISSFASIGNRADVTASDFLEYWEGDEATRRGAALHRVF